MRELRACWWLSVRQGARRNKWLCDNIGSMSRRDIPMVDDADAWNPPEKEINAKAYYKSESVRFETLHADEWIEAGGAFNLSDMV